MLLIVMMLNVKNIYHPNFKLALFN